MASVVTYQETTTRGTDLNFPSSRTDRSDRGWQCAL